MLINITFYQIFEDISFTNCSLVFLLSFFTCYIFFFSLNVIFNVILTYFYPYSLFKIHLKILNIDKVCLYDKIYRFTHTRIIFHKMRYFDHNRYPQLVCQEFTSINYGQIYLSYFIFL